MTCLQEEWFNPGSTEYDSILAYNSYDVTAYLQTGENAMGAILGEGWWTGMTTFECTNNNYYGDQPASSAVRRKSPQHRNVSRDTEAHMKKRIFRYRNP